LAIIRLVDSLPNNRVAEVIGRQLLRSGTSVAANYRSACRARSRKDFIAKMGIVEEEADESQFWLETLAEAGVFGGMQVESLCAEAGELVAITVTSIRTARRSPSAIPHSTFRIPHSCS
jgi:four helix bundle protein